MSDSPIYRTIGRRLLFGDVTYYISKSGNDSNDGLTAATAFLTFNRASHKLREVDAGYYKITLSIGSGTWNEGLLIDDSILAREMILAGSGSSTIIDGKELTIRNNNYIIIKDLKFINSENNCISSTNGFVRLEGNLWFSNYTSAGLWLTNSIIQTDCYAYFSESCPIGVNCIYASSLDINDISKWNFSNVTSNVVLVAGNNSMISFYSGSAMTGSVNGPKYDINTGGIINTGGRGASAIPGSAGGISSGGQFL
jgi:hypothetical protein